MDQYSYEDLAEHREVMSFEVFGQNIMWVHTRHILHSEYTYLPSGNGQRKVLLIILHFNTKGPDEL